MKTKFSLALTAATTALLLSACASTLKPLASSNAKVDPQPLELRGGIVPAKIILGFPKGWFNRNAEVRITPVLKYPGGETWGTQYSFQGEKVRGNASTIRRGEASTVTLHSDFAWKPEMRNAELVLLFDAKVNGQRINLPELKIGEGTLATEAIADAGYVRPAIAPDGFQRVIREKYDADIHFLIQQANLRSSEINSRPVQEWKEIVESANMTPNQSVDVEVQAYASPDGGLELNEKLAAQREQNTSSYLKRELKRMEVDAPVAAHYTAQDWEGFKALIEKSNLQDKDLVLRVLSMYPDPEVREHEIKNISSVFGQLADVILPQLRRSRLIANVKIIGKSDAEIQQMVTSNPGGLKIDELLYAATLTDQIPEQQKVYATAARLFPADFRSYNNLGAIAFQNGYIDTAEKYFIEAQQKADAAGLKPEELLLNRGLVELSRGNISAAQTLIGQVSDIPALDGALGLIQLKQGKYAEAAKLLRDETTNNGVLAQILNKDYSRAIELIDRIAHPDATTHYLRALVGARTGQSNLISEGLSAAFAIEPAMKSQIIKDREFSKYVGQSFFNAIVR